ncbi:hypothetical protein CLHOM_34550 [Clostridium homopropionicum DSM 5847]|uniref:Uncharacterized protein n=1 Tax=Clostridium homopropionicum DSM 5847 TaxID=1121318 RepID=A0A0L6Z6U4_9CLOT|nr:hypothetical protein [Clostridium homopropionicum]KOA18553.1 hypothetical protein CLHOM_34550 [Clostridium homopropionicum DSM 5847]SFF64923.1 hypothetical protein SAMN04488501_10124 [Clostridium homopropionicum]
MGHVLEPVSEELFKAKVKIRFSNINEGFDKFQNFILKSKGEESKNTDEQKFIEFIEKVFHLNGYENSYVDFYLSKLDEEAKNNLFTLLEEEDRSILKTHINEIKDETIFFRLQKEAVHFITRLCTREILFSTFYFTKFPCTIWGNYNMRFPMFFDDEDNVDKYKEVSESCGLSLE